MTSPSRRRQSDVTTGKPAPDGVSVLIVDDEARLRELLAVFLRERGFEVTTVGSAELALERLREGRFALMLLDLRLPGMSGIDAVPAALNIDPDLGIVILSGLADATSATTCLQRGAFDYLTKPVELREVEAALTRASRRRDTLLQERSINTWLKKEMSLRRVENRPEPQESQDLTIATLKTLIAVLEAKSDYLAGHSARVASFAASLADEAGLPEEQVENIRLAGWLHDLGMIGVREEVLNKRGRLTNEEYTHVQRHTVIGARILAPVKRLAQVAPYVRSHHERWDGAGYPDGLAGDEIPVGGRILCIAEIYDALTTVRPHQDAMTPKAATDRMREMASSVIDPHLMKAFDTVVERRQLLVFVGADETGYPACESGEWRYT